MALFSQPRQLTAMREAVQSRSGEAFAAEQLGPILERITHHAAEFGSAYGRHKRIESRLAGIYRQPSVNGIVFADFKKVH